MQRVHDSVPFLLLAILCTACTGSQEQPPPPAEPPSTSTLAKDPLPPPPWQRQPLAGAEVPNVFLSEWREAENRATCAPLAADFGGGWGVAYDLPELRSAFGVAGADVSASAPSYSDWPYHRRWADGSTAGYGPEGGTGPKQLAYLRVAGQGCLYNVWSQLGREHLEWLLSELRYVEQNG